MFLSCLLMSSSNTGREQDAAQNIPPKFQNVFLPSLPIFSFTELTHHIQLS